MENHHLIPKTLMMKNEHAFAVSELKQQLCNLEEQIDWKQQEIKNLKQQVEKFYQQLGHLEGDTV